MRRFAHWLGSSVLLLGGTCYAAEFKSLDVVDATTLALRFDELASVEWGELGHGLKDQKIITVPLDTQRAGRPDTYTVDGAKIAKVGRKTRPHTFVRGPNSTTRNALEHFIYLKLDRRLEFGQTVTVSLPADLVSGGPASRKIVYDPTLCRSEALHVNQLGYMPGAAKIAYVSAWLGDLAGEAFTEGAAFHILDAQSRKSVFEGAVRLRKKASEPDSSHAGEGNHYRTDLYECDFSSFNTPGSYVLSVQGVGCSYPFQIAPDVYRQAYITLMRGMYHQRCGTELKEPYTSWTHPACHTQSLRQTDHRYMDQHFSEGARGPFKETGELRENVWGGWHDAADWDREGTHADIPSKILLAYELTPDHYADGELNIPESGNGVPDIVDEAAWGVDCYRRLQRPEGGVSVGMWESASPRDGETSWTDSLTRYCYAEEPVCSYKQSAAAAHLALTLRKLGRDADARPYLESAVRAWRWAGENLREGDEKKVRDDRFHAAAALYRATGDSRYQESCKRDCAMRNQWEPAFNWPDRDQTLAVWTFALAEDELRGLDTKFRDLMRKIAIQNAQNDMQGGLKRGGRAAYNWWFPLNWGRGSQVDNLAMMMAHRFSGDKQLLEVMVASADVTLGANPLNMTWVTGLGSHSPQQIMHINCWYDPKGPNPGVTPPGPFAYQKGAPAGVWQIGYAWKFVYPDASQWPPLELWFEDRLCPPTNEHVVERQATMAISMGYLCQSSKRSAETARK